MRRYRNKPYKLKPYKGYRRRSKKPLFLLIGIILIGLIVMGYILPKKELLPWQPFFELGNVEFFSQDRNVKDKKKGLIPLDSYERSPETSYSLHKERVKVKGIYVTGNRAGSDQIDELIKLCNRTEINAMVIDVKGDEGYLTFNVDNNIIKQAGIIPSSVPIKDIGALISRLYENDIYPIARIVTFKDNVVRDSYPEYMLRNKDGSFYESREPGNQRATWLNPYNKDTWEYILNIAKEAAAVGFKEIQFDYIRFHEGMLEEQVDFAYDSASKGKTQVISEFTKYISQELGKEGVYVSADVFGAIITSEFDAKIVGQNYREMSKHLDYVSPMIYPSHYAKGSFGVEDPDLEPYDVIVGSMLASNNQLNSIDEEDMPIIRPWLQDFTAGWIPRHKVYGAREIREQIDGVYDAGHEEWLLWNASNVYTEEGLLAK